MRVRNLWETDGPTPTVRVLLEQIALTPVHFVSSQGWCLTRSGERLRAPHSPRSEWKYFSRSLLEFDSCT